MSDVRSHYEILGVSRTATGQEIRAAYLRLMKRHHPDSALRDGNDANYAPLLNRCYAVLRDPVKRSQYDSRLLRRTTEPAKFPIRRLRRPKRSRGWWPAAALVSGAMAATALLLLSSDLSLERTSRALAARALVWMSDSSAPAAAPLPIALPDGSQTRQMSVLGRTLNSSDAERFSRSCFSGSDGQQLDLGYADSCVVFDSAFLYWRKMPLSETLPVYFADESVNSRHRDAMIGFGEAADQRLADLRQMAFLALMQDLERTRSAPDVVRSSAAVEDPSELLAGERQRLAAGGSQPASPDMGTEPSGLRSPNR